MLDIDVEVAIIGLSATDFLNTGLPFDKFDILVASGKIPQNLETQKKIHALMPSCRIAVMADSAFSSLEYLHSTAKLNGKSVAISSSPTKLACMAADHLFSLLS